jgi:glycosyltransferase involved in cell wall biosynthesis
MNLKKSIDVIIPCYNEIRTIEKVISKIKNQKINNLKIIIVDDFSVDGTREYLKNINDNNIKTVFHNKNFGKGMAIRSGIAISNSDIIIIQDADLEYSPDDYNKLLTPFDEIDADIVYGSRFIGGSKYVRVHYYFHYIANKILTNLCNMFTNLNMSDMETGMKAFKSDVIKSINLTENDFRFEPEVTIKLAKKKYKFFEIGVSYNGRSYEEGKKITLIDAFKATFSIFKHGLLS